MYINVFKVLYIYISLFFYVSMIPLGNCGLGDPGPSIREIPTRTQWQHCPGVKAVVTTLPKHSSGTPSDSVGANQETFEVIFQNQFHFGPHKISIVFNLLHCTGFLELNLLLKSLRSEHVDIVYRKGTKTKMLTDLLTKTLRSLCEPPVCQYGLVNNRLFHILL